MTDLEKNEIIKFIRLMYGNQHIDVDRTIDFIYMKIDDWFENQEFDKCDYLLSKLDFPGPKDAAGLNVQSIITYLTITLSAKDKLKNRVDFFKRAKEYLLKFKTELQVNNLLKGLE